MENKNNYLIPANSKKSQLYFGFFNVVDLIILGIGLGITLLLLLFIKSNNVTVMLMLALPALIAIFLVLPVPHYHNVMTLIGNIYRFYTGRKKYYWRGWCVSYGNHRNK